MGAPAAPIRYRSATGRWVLLATVLGSSLAFIDATVVTIALPAIGRDLGALAILEASFAPEDRSRAIGAWSGLAGIGGALGPFLGGWLVAIGSWRLIFLINVPVAAAVLAVAARHVPESRDPAAAAGRLDLAGVLTGAAALTGLTYGFTAWPAAGPGDPVVLGSLAAGLASMVAFVLVERHSRHPLLPLSIFGNRAFTGANLVTFLVYAANGGVFFLVGVNLQVVAGFGPLAAGLALLPVTGLMLLLSARAGAFGQRAGPRLPMTAGSLVCAGALVLLSRIGADAGYARDALPAVLLFGLGLSLLVAPLTATALGGVDDAHAGVASGVNNAVARAAGLLAVAVLPLAAGLGAGNLTDPVALHPVYRTALLICAALMAGGAVLSYLLIPRRVPAHAPAHSFCDPSAPPRQPRVPADAAG